MHTTMNRMQTPRKSERGICDAAISGSVIDRAAHSTLNGGAPELPRERVQQALADFGVPKKRQHFVNAKRSTPRTSTGREPRIENLAPEEWRPRHACALTMDKALREMEFPSRLAGAEWVLP